MKENEEQIKSLRLRVEETAGMAVVRAKDFERLVVMIYERTGSLLSPTTLKRIWGYLKENAAPRRSTLDVLAQYCGWGSYQDFLNGDRLEIESGFVDVKVLDVERDMRMGNVVKLMWHPRRVCRIKYLGESRWEVLEAEGTRLQQGDTFSCSMIMWGEPLYLGNVAHGTWNAVCTCAAAATALHSSASDRLTQLVNPNVRAHAGALSFALGIGRDC